MTLTLIIKQEKDGFLVGHVKELPDVFAKGLTESEITESISNSLESYFDPPTFIVIYDN
jgi:predicted RNase H-like HicB family nuclease